MNTNTTTTCKVRRGNPHCIAGAHISTMSTSFKFNAFSLNVAQKTRLTLPTKIYSRRQRFKPLENLCPAAPTETICWSRAVKDPGPFGRIWAGRCWSTSSLKVHASCQFMRVWMCSVISFPTLWRCPIMYQSQIRSTQNQNHPLSCLRRDGWNSFSCRFCPRAYLLSRRTSRMIYNFQRPFEARTGDRRGRLV